MLKNPWVLYTILALMFLLAVYGYVKLFRMRNSPDGERLLRNLANGPFVPLSKADMEEDEQRRKK